MAGIEAIVSQIVVCACSKKSFDNLFDSLQYDDGVFRLHAWAFSKNEENFFLRYSRIVNTKLVPHKIANSFSDPKLHRCCVEGSIDCGQLSCDSIDLSFFMQINTNNNNKFPENLNSQSQASSGSNVGRLV